MRSSLIMWKSNFRCSLETFLGYYVANRAPITALFFCSFGALCPSPSPPADTLNYSILKLFYILGLKYRPCFRPCQYSGVKPWIYGRITTGLYPYYYKGRRGVLSFMLVVVAPGNRKDFLSVSVARNRLVSRGGMVSDLPVFPSIRLSQN